MFKNINHFDISTPRFNPFKDYTYWLELKENQNITFLFAKKLVKRLVINTHAKD